ncbi:hypothetical protein SAMN05421799_10677 [Alicyclobacillus vulcanalis]|uniref:Uncharacterized protein n=1 Tax=Alicyclobacillus vulcanalis TaxID=252246 RepID=A0A1N7MSG8_9BACL|nr:hypothetical protein SAMN05421799_10677 [Alicyclobacillus vulcanalis]
MLIQLADWAIDIHKNESWKAYISPNQDEVLVQVKGENSALIRLSDNLLVCSCSGPAEIVIDADNKSLKVRPKPQTLYFWPQTQA